MSDEQPSIFDDLIAEAAARPRIEKDKPVRTYAHGGCPKCSDNAVGLALVGQHLFWKDHDLRTWGGVSMQCQASGQRLCDLPARDVAHLNGNTTPTCNHA